MARTTSASADVGPISNVPNVASSASRSPVMAASRSMSRAGSPSGKVPETKASPRRLARSPPLPARLAFALRSAQPASSPLRAQLPSLKERAVDAVSGPASLSAPRSTTASRPSSPNVPPVLRRTSLKRYSPREMAGEVRRRSKRRLSMDPLTSPWPLSEVRFAPPTTASPADSASEADTSPSAEMTPDPFAFSDPLSSVKALSVTRPSLPYRPLAVM